MIILGRDYYLRKAAYFQRLAAEEFAKDWTCHYGCQRTQQERCERLSNDARVALIIALGLEE